jgi:hypothetical protein
MDLNPPIYLLLKSFNNLTDLLGGSESPRIYSMSSAPQGQEKPYITWKAISNIAEQNISDSPDVDFVTLQVDCWSKKEFESLILAYNTRAALESFGNATDIIGQGRETETKLYRVTLQSVYIFNRS